MKFGTMSSIIRKEIKMCGVKAVYIHVPFCKNICPYCDFCKFYLNDSWVNNYLISLEKEIKSKYQKEIIKTIYIGGGTPSCLSIKDLKRLFKIIKIFKVENPEITFECNLNDITKELLTLLKDSGVNRLSIGIQSFNKQNQEIIGRNSSFKDALEKINLCKSVGISNINVDLIYAIKGQSIKSLKKDLQLFTKLPVMHLSTYSLMIEPNTILYNQKFCPIDENIDEKMYQFIIKYLKKKGFNHYEISNFAKKGYESKHNNVYWYNENYYGFGPGASGYLNNIRYDNTKNLNAYFKGDFILNEEKLSKKDIMDYEIMLGMRLTKGINVQKFNEKYHCNLIDLYNIKTLIKEKLLIYKKGNIFIHPGKLYIMNEILIRMI